MFSEPRKKGLIVKKYKDNIMYLRSLILLQYHLMQYTSLNIDYLDLLHDVQTPCLKTFRSMGRKSITKK